jgi:Tol biopolymer transport system component
VSGPAGPNDRTGIWVLTIVGGAIRKLRDDAVGAVVSPDGARIAFVSTNEIWLMGANGEDANRLAIAEEGYGFDELAWPPDGHSLVDMKSNRGYDRVVMEKRELNGREVAIIMSDPRLRGFCLAPDGHIIYDRLENSEDATANIWEVRMDSSTSRPSGEPRRLTNWAGFTLRGFSITADGKRIAFVRKTDQSDVYVGTLDKSGLRLTATHRLTLDDRMDWPGGWLQESDFILFFSDRNGNFDVFEQGMRDRTPTEVIADSEEKRSPQLSPDGSWILYLTFPRAQGGLPPASGRLMRVPVSGGSPELVLEANGYPGSARVPRERWLPSARGYPDFRCSSRVVVASPPCVLSEVNGKQVVFTAFDPRVGKRGELARIDFDPSDSFWDLSLDGSRIAFGKFEGRGGHIRILDLAGGKTREISVKGWSHLTSVGWSADGRSLFATNWASIAASVLRVELDGETHPLYKAPSSMQLERPVPSPDGRYLAFAEVGTASNAWMMENF